MAESDHRPDPSPDSEQMKAAQRALLREYGNVIGENQALNIANHVLVAARYVTFNPQK